MTSTTTTALTFKSFTGGEYRATAHGDTYSVKRLDADTFEARVRYANTKAFVTLGSGGDKAAAVLVCEAHATTPDELVSVDVAVQREIDRRAPQFVQPAADPVDVASMLRDVTGDTDELAQAAAQGAVDQDQAAYDYERGDFGDTSLGGTPSRKADTKADDAAKRAAKAQATRKANAAAPALPPVDQLVFTPFRGDDDDKRAKGAKYAYRVVRGQAGGYYASQRTCSWTPIAGKCATEDQAVDLCHRYEKGARQLSHRKYQGMPYALAIEALDAQ